MLRRKRAEMTVLQHDAYIDEFETALLAGKADPHSLEVLFAFRKANRGERNCWWNCCGSLSNTIGKLEPSTQFLNIERFTRQFFPVRSCWRSWLLRSIGYVPRKDRNLLRNMPPGSRSMSLGGRLGPEATLEVSSWAEFSQSSPESASQMAAARRRVPEAWG